MKLGWKLGLLVAVMLIVLGCKSGPEARPAASDNPDRDAFGGRAAALFMPLNLGNSWTYQREFLGEKGELKVMIVSRDAEGFYVDDQGGKFKVTPFGLRDTMRYLLLSPIETGQRWRAQVAVNIAEHFEIVEDFATVSVPAGTFEGCVVVQSTTHATRGARIVTIATYAPKVGLIRMETRLENNQGRMARQFLLELSDWSIAGEAAPDAGTAEEPTPQDSAD